METFEEFLQEHCPSSYITNNSNEGYENWLNQLDVNEVIDYAEQYGIKLKNNYKIKNNE